MNEHELIPMMVKPIVPEPAPVHLETMFLALSVGVNLFMLWYGW